MLSFEQKLTILDSFPELVRKSVSLGRINYHYEQSVHEKKTVAYHLHPNGSGYVYGALLSGYTADDKGYVQIRDFSEVELRDIVAKSIQSLSVPAAASPASGERRKRERWVGANQHILTVTYEDELWYVHSGLNLDAAFETYDELEEYMQEEGYTRA
jgi:hypothetical protein